MKSRLHETLGEIAVADAAVDLWLVEVAAEMLRTDPNVVRTLLSSDSSTSKVAKIKRLMSIGGLPEESKLRDALNGVNELKQRRDSAIHAYYVQAGPEEFVRHRARTEPNGVQLKELEGIRDDLYALLDALEQGLRELSLSNARMGDASEFFRDCFEILAALRIAGSGRILGLQAPEQPEMMIVELYGQGDFAVSAVNEVKSKRQTRRKSLARARITPIDGQVHITLEDGREFSGGDTGWRNVLEEVRAVTPDAERRFWRRTNDAFQYVADEYKWWPEAGLDDRLTGGSSKEMVERMQREMATFMPDDTPK